MAKIIYKNPQDTGAINCIHIIITLLTQMIKMNEEILPKTGIAAFDL